MSYVIVFYQASDDLTSLAERAVGPFRHEADARREAQRLYDTFGEYDIVELSPPPN